MFLITYVVSDVLECIQLLLQLWNSTNFQESSKKVKSSMNRFGKLVVIIDVVNLGAQRAVRDARALEEGDF
jgi:hypothetical protein